MKQFGFKGALCAALMLAFAGTHAADPVDPARQAAPADGWASQAGGTVGGSAAASSHIYTVNNRKQLLAAIANGGLNPKIIKVNGVIDMSEGLPYVNTGDQAARGAIRLKSNTTLIGAGGNAGFINGHIVLSSVSQIIIRNLKIAAPCDVGPVWDPTDGATGNWNSAYDAIGVSGSDHVWIDHNSFTDAPITDDMLPVENGKTKQCHDGALDITNASDFVTVSYNNFSSHNKNKLIGSGDSATGDEGKLRITFSNNVFSNITQRAPRVRYGMVHLYNNYYAGDKKLPVYPHSYSVGAGHQAKILSNNNVFAITGATNCNQVVVNSGGTSPTFKDSGSTLNGAPLGACAVSANVSWTVPYAFTPRPVSLVKANALNQAGGGKLSTSITGTGSVEVRPMTNGATGNKQLYLLTRYVDASDWLGGGLNVQNSTTSSFSAISSNPAVVADNVSGNNVTLTPVGEGTAKIVFAGASEPTLTRTISATIMPQFIQPAQTYILTGASFPAAASVDEPIDTSLKRSPSSRTTTSWPTVPSTTWPSPTACSRTPRWAAPHSSVSARALTGRSPPAPQRQPWPA